MRALRCCAVAMLVAAGAQSAAHAETRAYVMRGLFGGVFTPIAMDQIGAALRQRGMIVRVGSWTEAHAFAVDACSHSGARVVIVTHSLGGPAGAVMAREVRGCGIGSVRLVAVDPPALGAIATPGVETTTFVGSLGGDVAGGHDIRTTGYGHLAIVNDPRMQARIVSAASH